VTQTKKKTLKKKTHGKDIHSKKILETKDTCQKRQKERQKETKRDRKRQKETERDTKRHNFTTDKCKKSEINARRQFTQKRHVLKRHILQKSLFTQKEAHKESLRQISNIVVARVEADDFGAQKENPNSHSEGREERGKRAQNSK